MAPYPSDPLLDAFGAAIRELRQRRGLSQQALATLAEVERTYLTEVELGRRNVTLINVGRLALALGVGVGELMTVAERHLAGRGTGDGAASSSGSAGG
jgi:transcriptional regulator with XRE-family HTH domain